MQMPQSSSTSHFFLNHGFIVESNPSQKVVIVEKQLEDTDTDNIQKLEDSPALAFINE